MEVPTIELKSDKERLAKIVMRFPTSEFLKLLK